MRHTRRFMETYNNSSICTAANETFTLTCKKDAINKLRMYIEDPKDQTHEHNTTKYDWTPCRFQTLGWKY